MSTKMVRISFDTNNPPPLTEAMKAEIEALKNKPDSEIDFSDIPPLTEEFWKNARTGLVYGPRKTSTTLRIDRDVLDWLEAQGEGYQARINAILRREMVEAQKKPAGTVGSGEAEERSSAQSAG